MTDHTRPLPPKKEIALALLKGGPSMFVHLDPRRPGVIVPKSFTGQPQLILQLGLNMVIPIPDFKLDDECMSCTLSFNRMPFWCRLPWTAIYALVGEDGTGHPLRRRGEVRRRPAAGDIETPPSGIQRVVPGLAPGDGSHEDGL